MQQIFFPEGFFSEALAISNICDVENYAGKDIIVSGEALSYNWNTKIMEVRLYDDQIGIINVSTDKDFTYHSLVGTMINFKIVSRIDDKHWLCERDSLVKKAKEYIFSNCKTGQPFEGIVDSFVGYGCFIDIGWGVTGLLHNSDISQYLGRKIKHPSEIIKLSQNVKVSLKDIDTKGNISLNLVSVFPVAKNA